MVFHLALENCCSLDMALQNGKFSVQSAYHLTMDSDLIPMHDSGSARRVSKKSVEKKVLVDFACPLCSHERADLSRVPFHCPFALQIWTLSFLSQRIFSCRMDSVSHWVSEIILTSIDIELELFIMICLLTLEKSSHVLPMLLEVTPLEFRYNGATATHRNTFRTGVVVLNWDGGFVAGSAKNYHQIMDAEVAEAMTAIDATAFVKSKCLSSTFKELLYQ
ncbi:hypothetical protein ACH5RR_013004 [Cinchona calisaya]|uniref:RNase H type-1 domain-containing protein n=1 Tax=Cinchona calisaya TaxID=153742 RepID=A0ABD3A1G8_9GENT